MLMAIAPLMPLTVMVCEPDVALEIVMTPVPLSISTPTLVFPMRRNYRSALWWPVSLVGRASVRQGHVIGWSITPARRPQPKVP